MKNRIGGLRRSHVVTTFGPGAIVDFRAPHSGAPLSGVLAGLDEWDAVSGNRPGLMHPQVVHEPRLEKRLGVAGFRLPPVKPGRQGDEEDQSATDVLPVVRFPLWLQCPVCNRLAQSRDWNHDPGEPERRCARCSGDEGPVWAVPVRFVVACEEGHLDEFPWTRWIGCTCKRPALELETTGPGLGGKVVRCTLCNVDRSMEDVFKKHAMTSVGCSCSGFRPWIDVALPEQRCGGQLQVLQRGASNVYWGDTQSALDIPPYSPDPSYLFGPYWPAVRDTPPNARVAVIQGLLRLLPEPLEVLVRAVEEWVATIDSDSVDEDVRVAEYRQFQRSITEPQRKGEFETRPEPVAAEFAPLLSGVALARRLREVRAQVGFTRIRPPGGMFRASRSPSYNLSRERLPWLPAIELRGEGIFLVFDATAIQEWETRPVVQHHFDRLARRVELEQVREASTPDQRAEVARKIADWRAYGPRFVMIHSFSHALMRQLALECGYSSAALRERLYVGSKPLSMMGVLIHTDSPDSEGTLGGLVRQGRTDRLRESLVSMLRDARWCSSDPVCITGTMTLSTPQNGAACHACMLAPETSCEHFNTLLDRAFLVGTDDNPGLGFFRQYMDESL